MILGVDPQVAYGEQEQAEPIHWDGHTFQIRVRDADTLGRQRFSCAHAIIHTSFFESHGHGHQAPAFEDGWSEAEEELCDLGAANLLLPEAAFRRSCSSELTMHNVLQIAEDFQASAEATALRAVSLSSTPLSMVVLEKKLKPTEQREQARRAKQPSLPGMGGPPIVRRLRVAKSYGHGMGFILRDKSAGDATVSAGILEQRPFDRCAWSAGGRSHDTLQGAEPSTWTFTDVAAVGPIVIIFTYDERSKK
jgi:IrrE N-terminal-like domain